MTKLSNLKPENYCFRCSVKQNVINNEHMHTGFLTYIKVYYVLSSNNKFKYILIWLLVYRYLMYRSTDISMKLAGVQTWYLPYPLERRRTLCLGYVAVKQSTLSFKSILLSTQHWSVLVNSCTRGYSTTLMLSLEILRLNNLTS